MRCALYMSAILGKSVYLDQGVYLHTLPAGITIGEGTFIIHHTHYLSSTSVIYLKSKKIA